jgi:hypothetical protein
VRQVFSSPRLENVEMLEKLFAEAGIATKISNRSTWKRGTKRDFSYTERGGEASWPALWVLQADDLGRAREILRECGLLESTRVDSYAPRTLAEPTQAGVPDPQRSARRARTVLFLITLILAAVTALRLAGLL